MSAVDDHLANIPPAQKTELERIRALIKQVSPDAEEVITYGMPGFTYKGKYLIAYAAFKDHMSLFPGASPVDALKERLKNNITGRGTIQLTPDNPLTDETIKEIVCLSMEQIDSI